MHANGTRSLWNLVVTRSAGALGEVMKRSGGSLVAKYLARASRRDAASKLPSFQEQVGVPAGLGVTGTHPVVESLDARLERIAWSSAPTTEA